MDEINTQLQQNDSNERKENNVLIKCRACGKDMSYFAKSCPNCGHPNEALAEDVQKKTVEQYYSKIPVQVLSTIVTVVIAVYFCRTVFDFNLVASLLTCIILFWTTLISLTMNRGYISSFIIAFVIFFSIGWLFEQLHLPNTVKDQAAVFILLYPVYKTIVKPMYVYLRYKLKKKDS